MYPLEKPTSRAIIDHSCWFYFWKDPWSSASRSLTPHVPQWSLPNDVCHDGQLDNPVEDPHFLVLGNDIFFSFIVKQRQAQRLPGSLSHPPGSFSIKVTSEEEGMAHTHKMMWQHNRHSHTCSARKPAHQQAFGRKLLNPSPTPSFALLLSEGGSRWRICGAQNNTAVTAVAAAAKEVRLGWKVCRETSHLSQEPEQAES